MWGKIEMGFSQCALVNIPICRPVPHCLVARFCVQIPDPSGPFPTVKQASWSRKTGKKTGLENVFLLHNKKIVLFFLIYICCMLPHVGMKWNWVLCPPICVLSSMGLHYPRGWSTGHEMFVEKILKQKIKFSTKKSSFPDKRLLFSTTNSNFTVSFFWPKNTWSWCIHAGYRRKGLSFGGFFLLWQPYCAYLCFVCLGCVTNLYLPAQTLGRQHFSFGNF